jgi:ribosomal protein S12
MVTGAVYLVLGYQAKGPNNHISNCVRVCLVPDGFRSFAEPVWGGGGGKLNDAI